MATWYINADTGDDTTGDGSSGTPWLTISKAHTEASSGDTIICQDSTATYTFTTQTFTKNLTIQGQSADASGAIFDGASANLAYFWNVQSSITIKYCTFRDGGGSITAQVFKLAVSSASLIMTSCKIHDLKFKSSNDGDGGIFGITGSTNCSITLTQVLIYDCELSNGAYIGGYIGLRVESLETITITNCTFITDTSATIPIDAFIYLLNVSSSTLTVTNTIFRDLQESGLDAIYANQTTTALTYNCYSGTTDEGGTGSITSDPLFVDEANNNFNLRPTSPCIDTGTLV